MSREVSLYKHTIYPFPLHYPLKTPQTLWSHPQFCTYLCYCCLQCYTPGPCCHGYRDATRLEKHPGRELSSSGDPWLTASVGGGWKHWWDIAKTGIRYIDNEAYYYTTGNLNGLHETEGFENEQNALGTERNFFWLYACWILACWYWLCVALVRVFKFNNCIILNVVQNRWFNVSETLNLYSMKWIFFNVKKNIEIDRHISVPYRFKPTISDHCQMNLNWHSHDHLLQSKTFLWEKQILPIRKTLSNQSLLFAGGLLFVDFEGYPCPLLYIIYNLKFEHLK